jgi:hypothetical protein
MKKERQIGVRVGLPAFFALEVEDIYRHSSGAHRALAFPDFLGLLIGLGLETYRKQYRQEKAPDIEGEPPEGEQPEAPDHGRNTSEPYKVDFWDFPDDAPVPRRGEDALRLFDLAPDSLPDLFREFDEAIKSREEPRGLHLVRAGGKS